LVINERNVQGSDLVPFHVILNEAVFFFEAEICDWLRTVREKCNHLLLLRSTQHLPDAPAAEIAARDTELFDLLTEMPRRFESELGFRHVRRSVPPS
jgi:hypothetical protein